MQIQELLLNKKLKLTVARKELLEIFFYANKPLSYEDLKHKLSMDKATFYRNISKFEDESIVNSFESNDKKRYYEIQKKAHSHFICNICNSIDCINPISDINLNGYIIEDVIIKGVCKNCNN
jgi:Fur family ferric uptake transcriptional regulator